MGRHYIFYFIQSIYNQGAFFNFEGKTSGLKNLNVELAYSSIPVPKVSFANQRKIGKFLSSIDRLIQLSRKRIENLEKLAKEIYDYWFVQFDFPDEHGKPYKSSGGKMVYNAQLKREIPAGWEVKRLEEVCETIQSGGTPNTKYEEYYKGQIPWLSTGELYDHWVVESKKHITAEAIENSAAKLFPEATVVMAIYAAPTVGRLGIVDMPATFNQACCGFVSGRQISKEYLFWTLKANRKFLNTIADGTAQKNLNVGKMRAFQIVVPPPCVFDCWRNAEEKLFGMMRNAEKHVAELSRLREFLLPLLMNGQAKMGGAA